MEGWRRRGGGMKKSKQFVYSVSNLILNNVLLAAFHSVKSFGNISILRIKKYVSEDS